MMSCWGAGRDDATEGGDVISILNTFVISLSKFKMQINEKKIEVSLVLVLSYVSS